MRPESELIERSRRRDLDAFSELVVSHQGAVRTFLARFVVAQGDVDDLAQETFLTAYRKLGEFQGNSSLRTWLIGIARREALAHAREAARRRQRELDSVGGLIEATMAGRLEGDDDDGNGHRLAALEECMESLGEESSLLVRSFYYAGQTTRQIGSQLGRSANAVAVTLFRVRETLRRCVDLKVREREVAR